ncbi:MAG: serine/threonine protein kinase, partial [Thauera sp.]
MADHNDDKTVIADKTVIVDIPASPSKPAQGAAGQSANMLPVGTRLGEFELIGLVGAGGFGIVYLAEDHSLGRRVALKEYMPAALAQRGEGLRVTLRSERNAETF